MNKMIPFALAAIVYASMGYATPAASAALCGVGGKWIPCAQVAKGIQVSYVPGCNGSAPGKKVKYGKRTFTCAGDR